ncbi:hypothetical protein C8R45DRAFT_1149018 [Mycena sanguinolenta]|nr:hypothetical protein C8R45DRAFT_1149018 [Mycena sanguinolenta]
MHSDDVLGASAFTIGLGSVKQLIGATAVIWRPAARAKNDKDSTARQRSFLRALVQHDYRTGPSTLLAAQTTFVNSHPGEPFLIIHDYSKGRVKMWVEAVRIVDAGAEFTGIEWESILSRAAVSGSETEIHVVRIYEPQRMRHFRHFVIPIRTSTLAVDTLNHLVVFYSHVVASLSSLTSTGDAGPPRFARERVTGGRLTVLPTLGIASFITYIPTLDASLLP